MQTERYIVKIGGRKTCRCGHRLLFSAEDIQSGEPQPGSDFWCSDSGNESSGPHDFGIVEVTH